VMREAVEQRRGQLFVAGKHGDPFGERQVACDHRRASLISISEEIKEQFAAHAIKGYESQFVHDQDVHAEQPLLEARERAGVACLQQLPDEIGRTREEHPAFLLRGFHAERDGQVRFPVPIGPARMRFSGAVTHSPRASVCTSVALRPSAAAKSKVSSVFTSGKRASSSRWRITD
jgi:hypothetical protein